MNPFNNLNVHSLKVFLKDAREAIAVHLGQETLISKPELSHGFRSMGVFVTLEKANKVRGCAGHLEPEFEDLRTEVKTCAVDAATQDPRFSPLSLQELPDIQIKLTFLSGLEPIDSVELLDPKTYGIVVEYNERKGTLLPNIDGIETIERQLSIACQKAGIRLDEPYQLKRYLTLKIKE